MSKLFKGLTLAFVVCLLAGCGGNNQTLTCTMTTDDESGETKQTVTANFADDKVEKVSVEMDVKTQSEQIASIAFSIIEASFEEMDKEEGVDVETKLDKENIHVKMSVDYTKVSEKFLSDNEDSGTFGKNSTLEDAKKELEEQGYTCK